MSAFVHRYDLAHESIERVAGGRFVRHDDYAALLADNKDWRFAWAFTLTAGLVVSAALAMLLWLAYGNLQAQYAESASLVNRLIVCEREYGEVDALAAKLESRLAWAGRRGPQ